MTQTEHMREALSLALAALKKVRYVDQQHSEAERAIEQSLITKPTPLVRLTQDEVDGLEALHIRLYRGLTDCWVEGVEDFAHAIMDAMIKKNGGSE